MGETAIFMKRHINGLKPGQLFTTRDCLPFGSRATVDKQLYRLVKANVLIRLARGVFTRNFPNYPRPTLEEIVDLKAKSFGRKIAPHGSVLADELELKKQTNKSVVYFTDSSSSSFKCGDITVYFKKTCWRKMALQKSKTGKVIVALWHLGQQQHNAQQVAKALEKFGQADRILLRESTTWIPAWLSVYFLNFHFNMFNRQYVTV